MLTQLAKTSLLWETKMFFQHRKLQYLPRGQYCSTSDNLFKHPTCLHQMKTLRQMAALLSDEIFIKNASGPVLPPTSWYDGALLVIISKHFNRREHFFLIILTGSRTQDCQMLNFILSTAAASWTVRVQSLRSLNDMFVTWNLRLLHFSSSRASRARLQDPDGRGRGPGTNRRLGLRPRGADGQAGHRPQAGDGQEAQGPGGPVEEGKGGGPRSVPAGEKGTSIVYGCYSQSYSHWRKVIMVKWQPSISLVDEWIRIIRLINQTYLLVGYISPLV